MVDSIGPKKIATIIKSKPVADEAADEHKRKTDQAAKKSPGQNGGDERLGATVDERC